MSNQPQNALDLVSLISRMASKDVKAFEAFFKSVSPELTEYLARLFSPELGQDDIEEIVSQTMLQILIHSASFKGSSERDARAWIFTIARNQAAKWVRVLKKELKHFSEEELTSFTKPDIQSTLEQWDKMIDAQTSLKMLSSVEKHTIELLIEGYSQTNIAEALKTSPARVSEIIREIRNKLAHHVLVQKTNA